jgi:hypothetical protein
MRRLSARDEAYRMGCSGLGARLDTVRRAAGALHIEPGGYHLSVPAKLKRSVSSKLSPGRFAPQ